MRGLITSDVEDSSQVVVLNLGIDALPTDELLLLGIAGEVAEHGVVCATLTAEGVGDVGAKLVVVAVETFVARLAVLGVASQDQNSAPPQVVALESRHLGPQQTLEGELVPDERDHVQRPVDAVAGRLDAPLSLGLAPAPPRVEDVCEVPLHERDTPLDIALGFLAELGCRFRVNLVSLGATWLRLVLLGEDQGGHEGGGDLTAERGEHDGADQLEGPKEPANVAEQVQAVVDRPLEDHILDVGVDLDFHKYRRSSPNRGSPFCLPVHFVPVGFALSPEDKTFFGVQALSLQDGAVVVELVGVEVKVLGSDVARHVAIFAVALRLVRLLVILYVELVVQDELVDLFIALAPLFVAPVAAPAEGEINVGANIRFLSVQNV